MEEEGDCEEVSEEASYLLVEEKEGHCKALQQLGYSVEADEEDS